MDRDWNRRHFQRLEAREDDVIDGLYVEYWAGVYPGRPGLWLCRRLVVSPTLIGLWYRTMQAGDPALDRALQTRAEALDQTTRGRVEQGGRHQWARPDDRARIIRQPIMSLN